MRFRSSPAPGPGVKVEFRIVSKFVYTLSILVFLFRLDMSNIAQRKIFDKEFCQGFAKFRVFFNFILPFRGISAPQYCFCTVFSYGFSSLQK